MMLGSNCSPCCDPCNGFSTLAPFQINSVFTDWFVDAGEPCNSIISSRPPFASPQDYTALMTCNGSSEANPGGGVPFAVAHWNDTPSPAFGSPASGDNVALNAACRVYEGTRYFEFGFSGVIGGESFSSFELSEPGFIGFPYGSAEPTELRPIRRRPLPLDPEVIQSMASGGWFGIKISWYNPNVNQSCWLRGQGLLKFYWPGLESVPQLGACRYPSANSPSGYVCQVTTRCECRRLANVSPALGWQFLGAGTSCNPLP
jgi:hypothetical protein